MIQTPSNGNLIASFRRPITDTYVTRPYSFLENFIPNTGAIARRGGFYNQWMRDSKGQWYEITEAKFSADATARKDAGFRLFWRFSKSWFLS